MCGSRISSAVPLAGYQGVGSEAIDYHMLDQLAAAQSIRLQDGDRILGEIGLPGADRAVRAMRECNDSALLEYGVDPARMASLRELPKLRDSWEALFSSLDYPADAVRLGISGISVVRLDIDIKGKVERCAIVKSSNNKDLDSSTCRGFSRARYDPAIGPGRQSGRGLDHQQDRLEKRRPGEAGRGLGVGSEQRPAVPASFVLRGAPGASGEEECPG